MGWKRFTGEGKKCNSIFVLKDIEGNRQTCSCKPNRKLLKLNPLLKKAPILHTDGYQPAVGREWGEILTTELIQWVPSGF